MERRHTATQVLVHWLFVIEATALVVTGFYLHRPVGGAQYGLGTFVHIGTGYALVSTVAFRLYWAILGEPMGLRAWAGALRRGGLRAASRHLAYLILWVSLAGLVVTGLTLRFPTTGIFDWVVYGLGGMVGVRIAHYLLTWVFLSATLLHTYQPLSHGWASFVSMFMPTRASRRSVDDPDELAPTGAKTVP